MSSSIISYYCEICDKESSLEVTSKKELSDSTLMMSKNTHKFIDHEEHIIELVITPNGYLNNTIIIPKLKSIMNILVLNNINLIRIVNNYLREEQKTYQNGILFLTTSKHIELFIANKISNFILSNDIVKARKAPDIIQMDFEAISFILTNNIQNLIFANSNSPIDTVDNEKNVKIKSLVIDSSSFSEELILKTIKDKKINFNMDLKVIISFNPKQENPIPLKLREVLEDKFKIKRIDLLNYSNIEGLKSITLQSYLNLVDQEFMVREEFELMDKAE